MQIEELYQTIGHLALQKAPQLNGKLLIYAEIHQGVVEAGMFYERGDAHTLTYRHCGEELEGVLYELWEHWQTLPGNTRWVGIGYQIQNGKLQIDLTYPDQLFPDEAMPERRPHVLRKYFGRVTVDYSSPGK